MSSETNRWDNYLDLLKLDDARLSELADSLPRPTDEEASARTWRRVRVPGQVWIPADIRDPTGSLGNYRVYPVDISTGGLSFLHGTFVHQSCPCRATLRLPDGEQVFVEGKVVRCEHVRGRAHLISIRFDRLFDMGLLFPDVDSNPGRGTSVVAQSPLAAGAPNSLAEKATDSAAQNASEGFHLGVELKLLATRLDDVHTIAQRLRVLGLSAEKLVDREAKASL